MHTHPTVTVAAPSESTRPTLRGAVLGTATGAAATSVLLALGNVGADVRVVTGWAPDGAALTYGEVVATVALSVFAGAGLLTLLARRAGRRRALRPWSAIAAGVAVLSAVPLWGLEVDTGSKLWLTAMHLAAGACTIAAQRSTHAEG